MTTTGLLDHRGRPIYKNAHLSAVDGAGGYVGGPDSFGDYEARKFRYALFWALYENNAYDKKLHGWANDRNRGSGLYDYTRGTYNPAYRLAEAFANHLYGGLLDPRAGDGKAVASAVPIETSNEAIRAPIARFWRDSNWATAKAIWGRVGTVTGDAPLYLYDDVPNRRICGEVLDPACLTHVGRDHRGNVRSYVRQEMRPNPTYNPAKRFARERALDPGSSFDDRPYVLYTETCWRDGEAVVFETYRGGGGDGPERQPYDWRGEGTLPPKWAVDYGFVPMVLNPHIAVRPGQWWGQGELNSLLTKIDEVNDLGSKLHDQIRKCVEGMWFFSGVRRADLEVPRRTPDADGNSQPGRQEMPILCAGMGATARELVIPLDIQFTSQEIVNQLRELERDSPMLRFDWMRAAGDASAKALREARKPAEGSVQERRSGYDDALVRAHKMAISMGSRGDYPEYEGFPPDAYESGKLDHHIGYRTVFGADPIDQAELDAARANAVAVWVGSGMPLRLALVRSGWTPDQLEEFDEAAERDREESLAHQEAQVALEASAEAVNPPKSSSGSASNDRPRPAESN